MKKEDKDIICDLWLQVFGVQEGIGRNCPNGVYEFAALILEEAAKICEKREQTGECYIEGGAESLGCAEAIRKMK